MKPGYRLPLCCLGGTFIPVRFLVHGWTVEREVFLIVPILGTGIAGLANSLVFVCPPFPISPPRILLLGNTYKEQRVNMMIDRLAFKPTSLTPSPSTQRPDLRHSRSQGLSWLRFCRWRRRRCLRGLDMDGGIRCWLFGAGYGACSVFSVLVWRENEEDEWREVEDFVMLVGGRI